MRAAFTSIAFMLALVTPASALDRDERVQIADEVAAQIADHFFDRQAGDRIAAALRNAAQSGRFDATNHVDFAEQMTAFLLTEDRHFNVAFSRASHAAPAPSAPQRSAVALSTNFGFRTVSVLPGNIGYIDLREFADVSEAGETATAALRFVSHTNAVVFDVRHNEGGAPAMLQFLISHFVDPERTVVINTFISSSRAYPYELRSLAYVPAGARPQVPLFVLTSADTGSAAEAFAYHLQAMRRATIVGETTAGAGNPGASFYAGHGFSVFVATSQTRNPITGGNWEGVGVQPDASTPAAQALDTALLLAYDQLLSTTTDADQRREFQWRREWTQNILHPDTVDVTQYLDVIGVYGERRIYLENGSLFYRFGDGEPRRLIRIGPDRFLLGDLENYRLTIQRSARSGGIVSLSLEQLTEPVATYARGE